MTLNFCKCSCARYWLYTVQREGEVAHQYMTVGNKLLVLEHTMQAYCSLANLRCLQE